MNAAEVLRVLDGLDTAGIPSGITGGWGIDGLLRREPELPLAFHERYEPREHDRRDMAALASAFGLLLPPPYSD